MAVSKSRKLVKTHARYEVFVEVYTPRERNAFTESYYKHRQSVRFDGPEVEAVLSS